MAVVGEASSPSADAVVEEEEEEEDEEEEASAVDRIVVVVVVAVAVVRATAAARDDRTLLPKPRTAHRFMEERRRSMVSGAALRWEGGIFDSMAMAILDLDVGMQV